MGRVEPPKLLEPVKALAEPLLNATQTSVETRNYDTGTDIIEIMRTLARQVGNFNTGRIAEGTIYHFYEGRKKDKDGHWQGNGYFYWQKVYKDPDTGKRQRKGGKSFSSCPDEERKRQYLRDTGRVIEPNTGRLQKVQRNTSPLFERTNASVYEVQG